MNYTKLANIGIIGAIISGILIIVLIFSGNAHYSIPIDTIVGRMSTMNSNPLFDYSVMLNFISLMIFGMGRIGEEDG